MSTNCIRCVWNVRTGLDLLCDTCRAAPNIISAIQALRRNEGASVTICCPNPEGDGLNNEAVIVIDDWTGWAERRFQGPTLEAALWAAWEAQVATEPKCGFIPPTPGYAPCTREKGHDGPCAHPLADDGVHINTRGCEPTTPEAFSAIAEATEKLRDHFEGRPRSAANPKRGTKP